MPIVSFVIDQATFDVDIDESIRLWDLKEYFTVKYITQANAVEYNWCLL